jgi:hypothetical protein
VLGGGEVLRDVGERHRVGHRHRDIVTLPTVPRSNRFDSTVFLANQKSQTLELLAFDE